MYVKDLVGVKALFFFFKQKTAYEMYHNPRTGLRTYFLSFDDGARLELMARPDTVARPQSALLTGYIHVSFSVGGREAVDRLTETLAMTAML